MDDANTANDAQFASNNNRVANRKKLETIINQEFGSAPREEIIRRLREADIAFGRLTDITDLTSHPPNRFIEVRAEGGNCKLMAPGFAVCGVTEQYDPLPTLGEHNSALRAEFGNPDIA